MFESIIVRQPLTRGLDAGLLAETLLFYSNVHLILDYSSLITIVREIGADGLTRLMDRNHVKISFAQSALGFQTVNDRGINVYSSIRFTVMSETGKFLSKDKDIERCIERALGRSKNWKRVAQKISDGIRLEPTFGHGKQPEDINEIIVQELRDPYFVNKSALEAFSGINPEYKIKLGDYFKIIEIERGKFIIDSSLPFDVSRGDLRGPISGVSILNTISDARADLALSALHMSQIATDPVTSRILNVKFNSMIRKYGSARNSIDLFQTTLLDTRNLRDAINRRERTFSEFLDFLDKSSRFRDFVGDIHPNSTLMEEYIRSTTQGTWISELPSKSVRFSAFTSLGILLEFLAPPGVGAAMALGLSAADTLLVDRIFGGWRPNQFVEQKLRPFVNAN